MEEGIGVDVITIPMNEYKELLIIKGKYEELKSQMLTIKWDNTYDKELISHPDCVKPTLTNPNIPITFCSQEGLSEIKKELELK